MKEIEKIIATYNQIDWQSQKAALGTVVKVEGSAYRRIGARLLVCSNGIWVGGISGGCLEGDALKQAQKAIRKNENSVIVYDTTEGDPHQIGVGLGCNGRIEVLFTPIDATDEDNQLEFLKKITNKRTPTILLQLLNVKGGDKSLRGKFCTHDRYPQLAAAIQVPLVEIEEKAASVFYQRKSKVYTFNNTKGQEYEILFELIRPKIKLVCIGDNYDINAFMGIAKELGWEVHVAGKPRKLTKSVYQNAEKVYTYEEAANIKTDEYTAIVLMSHDYKTDFTLLKKYLHLDVPYIGLLGPKKRMTSMQADLAAAGINVDLAHKPNLFSPVGLDIGAESPEEIALCIAAEIVAVFRKRNAGFLKDRLGTIHE